MLYSATRAQTECHRDTKTRVAIHKVCSEHTQRVFTHNYMPYILYACCYLLSSYMLLFKTCQVFFATWMSNWKWICWILSHAEEYYVCVCVCVVWLEQASVSFSWQVFQRSRARGHASAAAPSLCTLWWGERWCLLRHPQLDTHTHKGLFFTMLSQHYLKIHWRTHCVHIEGMLVSLFYSNALCI